jgi:hypothetical protein
VVLRASPPLRAVGGGSFATGFVVVILNEPLEADHVTTVAAAVVTAAVVAAVAAARRLGAGPRAVRA